MKKFLTYILIVGVFASLTWYVIEKGNHIVRQNQEISIDQSVIHDDKAKPVVLDFGMRSTINKELEFTGEINGTAEIITENNSLMERIFTPKKFFNRDIYV